MAKHNDTGTWGEQAVADTLTAEGCAIADRNWRSGHYELDIIAIHGNRIRFVEVKTRSSNAFDPLEAVDRRKLRRMLYAANTYMQLNDSPFEPQFDIFTVTGTPDAFTIERFEDLGMPNLTTF